MLTVGFGSGWLVWLWVGLVLSWVGFGLASFGILPRFAGLATLAGLAFTVLAFCWVGFGPGWLELWILPSWLWAGWLWLFAKIAFC